MKYVKSTTSFFIFLFIVLIPLNASAEIGDNGKKNWKTLFKQVRKISEHLKNLEVIQIKELKDQLENLLRQIEKNQEDQKKLKLGLAQDIERLGKLFTEQLKLQKQDRERTNKLLEESIQSSKMKENLKKTRQPFQTEKDGMPKLAAPSQALGRKVIGLWEIYTTGKQIVRRKKSHNTKIIKKLEDGTVVPVLQFLEYKRWTTEDWVWIEIEYEPDKIGWIDTQQGKYGDWVKKY